MNISRWKHVDDIDLTEIDDGFIAYDEAEDRVHHLNGTAALVFLLADGELGAEEISRVLQERFGLDTPPLGDVEEILEHFSREGLVVSA